MALKDSFTPDEWAKVIAAPMVAGIAVTAADPRGLVGAVRESMSVAGAVYEARVAVAPLIAEIGMAYDTAEGRALARTVLREQAAGGSPAAVVDAAIAEVREASALVAARVPEAAGPFREWLKATAQRVAEAGTEGGFLGFGGVKVSEAEKATLERLAAALG